MAGGTVKHDAPTSGTPTIISGSGASIHNQSWAFMSWQKYGQVVIVSVSGMYFSSAFNDAKDVLQLPFKAITDVVATQSKTSAFSMEIHTGSDRLQFSQVTRANETVFGQLVYLTND